MIKDPSTGWSGPFPYDVLAAAGVTWQTSHAEMQDVSFDLLASRMMTPRTQQAWDELRTVRRRLLADLLLYDVDLTTELAAAAEELESALHGAGEPPEAARCPQPLAQSTARLLDELIRFDR